MNISIKNIIHVLVVVVSILTFSHTVKADSNDFSVIPVLPENQNTSVSSYFDLIVSPNQKQDMQIEITNNSSENVKYSIYVNTAITNQNGIVDYSISEFDRDMSMKVSIKDCIYLEETLIEIPPKTTKEVSFKLNVPSTPFEGIALGGITVEPIVEEAKKEGVNNVFTRTLAIQLSESNADITPKLEGGEVSASQENLRNNVKFELRNVTPVIIQKVKADITITKRGSKHPILEETKEKLSFAPNSKFNLMTEWKKKFKAGDYIYYVNLSDEKGNTWEFRKEFEIKEDEAKKLNEKSVDVEGKTMWNYLLIIFVLIVVSLISILYIIIKKMKQSN